MLLAAPAVVGQTQPAGASGAWSAPKTPWGDPDIQGLWPTTEWKGVPLQRSESLGTRNVLTEDEFAEREQQAASEAASDAEEFRPPTRSLAKTRRTTGRTGESPRRKHR